MVQSLDITDLSQLESIASNLAKKTLHPAWIYLIGDLGAGKTTFTQFFVKHKGYQGRVTSPTYAIMQDYQTKTGTIIHCDLYRLGDPEELFEIGLLDIASEQNAITLIEWPEKGKGILPPADLILNFQFIGKQRSLSIAQQPNNES